MNGALSSTMKSRRIQPLLPGKSWENGSARDVVKSTQPNAITICYNSAKLDQSFRDGITIDVETFPGEKSAKNLIRSMSKPDTGRPPWWRKSMGNVEDPGTSFRMAPQEKNNEVRRGNERSHSSNSPIVGRSTSLSKRSGNVEFLNNSFRTSTKKKDKDSTSTNFLSRSFCHMSRGRHTSLSKSMVTFERQDKSVRIATQEKREGIRSSQDFSRQYSNPIGGLPPSLNKNMRNVEHLDSSFRIKPKEPRHDTEVSRSLVTPSDVRPPSLSKSMGTVECLDNSCELAPQKKPKDLKSRKDFSQSFRTASGWRCTSSSKIMGNVECLENSFKLAPQKKPKDLRNTIDFSQSFGTASGGRPTSPSKIVGNVECLDKNFKLTPQKKPTALRNRKDFSQSFGTASGGRPTPSSESIGNVECLDGNIKLAPQKRQKDINSMKNVSHSCMAPRGGRPSPSNKSMGNVECLDNSLKLKPEALRSRKQSFRTPNGRRPNSLTRSLGSVEYLGSSFRIVQQTKPTELKSRKDVPHSFSTASGGRHTWLSNSTGYIDCLGNSVKLAPHKKPKEYKRNDLSHSLGLPSGGRPFWLSTSVRNEHLDNSFKLAPQKKPKVFRQNMSHSFSIVSRGRPTLYKSTEKAEWPHCSVSMQSKPQGDIDDSSKRLTSYIFNMMVSKKRVTERQTNAQPSQHICQEQQVSVKCAKIKSEAHVGDKDECREFGKPHRIFSCAWDFVAHSNPIDVEAKICKNIRGHGLSKRSQLKLSLVSNLLDSGNVYDSKIENEEGQFRLSFVSDLSDSSGLSGIKNIETDNEDYSSNDAQQELPDTACQVRYPFIAAFSDGSVLKNHQREEQLHSSSVSSTTSHPRQASSSFLPFELTSMQIIPHLRDSCLRSSFLSQDSSERSEFSADFTVTGLFLDNTSFTPNHIYQHGTHDSLIMSTNDTLSELASVEMPEDDSIVTFSSQKLEDDSAVGICGSPLSSDDSATYNVHTKNANINSSEQHPRKSTSKTLLAVMVSMFKRTNSHRDDCNLVVDVHDKCIKREDGCILKCTNSKGFPFDFWAWEKRYK